MRSIFSMLRPGLSLSIRAALLLLAAGVFGACDRHSAAEVPENYGHGSSHERVAPDHQADSTGKEHFSDSAGTNGEEAGRSRREPAASPAPSTGGRIF